MIINRFGKHNFIIGCRDKDLLKFMQEKMDGKKVRLQNKIIIPLKSGPKILTFQEDDPIKWGEGVKPLIKSLILNKKRRVENIRKIKDQYNGKIKFNYECKGEYPPMSHQKIMYNMIYYNDSAALLAEPGTCKTGPYLWAIDKLIQDGKIKKAMVITLSDLKKNVMEEMEKQVPHLKGVILDSLKADKILNKKYKIKKYNNDYDIYISNYESMFKMVELFDDEYFDMIILDEAHRVGSPRSRQTKAIIDKFENIKRKYIITGSLNANNAVSFYMPFRFMGPDTVPYADFYGFRREYLRPVDDDLRIWIPRGGTKNLIKKIIGDMSVMFTKEECLDLPPIIRSVIKCKMKGSQEKLYKDLKKDLVAEIGPLNNMCNSCNMRSNCDMSCDEEVVAKNVLVLAQKLRQIASGFYMNTRTFINEDESEVVKKNIITLEENPKLSLLIKTLQNIPEDKKVIIWTNYNHAVKLIYERIEKSLGSGKTLTCHQNQDAFDQIKKFENKKYKYLIGNPSKMGAGHNIQFSSYQVFFSNSYSFVEREQAEGRQHRKGQKDNVTIIDLAVEGSIDELILTALKNKKDLSVSLSELAILIKNQK